MNFSNYNNRDLVFMYNKKLKDASEAEAWRKHQLEEDADKIFDELLNRQYFVNDITESVG